MGCIQSTPEVSYGSYSTNYVYLSDGTEESLEMYKANIGNSSKVCVRAIEIDLEIVILLLLQSPQNGLINRYGRFHCGI